MNIVLVKKETVVIEHDSKPMSLIAGDFDSDRITDIVTANSSAHNIGIFLGFNNNLSFTKKIVHSLDSSIAPCSIAADNFDSDLHMDIAFADFKSNLIGVILELDNGSFENLTFYESGLNSLQYSITARDIMVTNYDTSSIGLLLGYGNGIFSTVILFPLEYGSYSFSTVFGDFLISMGN